MTLKNDWAISEQFSNDDANDVANAVNAAYTAPGGGIPKTDLAAAVQSSLDLADSALQSLDWVGQPYPITFVVFAASTTRALNSYGDFPFGIKLQNDVTLTNVTFRCATADASGDLVVELRKNGVQISGTSTTIAAASQVAGGSSTGSWDLAAGDILTAYVTGIGTGPGYGLIVDITGQTR